MGTKEQRDSATCFIVTLDPSSIKSHVAIRAHRGDTMCLMEDSLQPGKTLGGQKISRGMLNIGIIERWLAQCIKLHGSDCAPVWTEELSQIRLVDVRSRKIVRYPADQQCEYVALSYVWGGVEQEAFKENNTVAEVPATIEDAIAFTRMLGKQYLWTDPLCIDQLDERDVVHQVNRMWSIYRGAYVTVIALSGTSAEAGLYGISRGDTYQQLTCCVRGRRIVGTMPTLS